MRIKFKICAIALITVLLFISGCGSIESQQDERIYYNNNVIKNYNFDGTERLIQFSKIPEHILVCGNNAADTLLAFGEGKKISVLVLTDIEQKNKYSKLLPDAKIYSGTIGQEAALMYKPDFILAERRFFDDKILGNNSFWNSNGIQTYIQDASGPIPSLGKFPPCTINSEKVFISNVGKIFCKEKIASKIIQDIDNELLLAHKQENTKLKILVVEFINDNIEVFGKNLLSGDIISKLGAEVIDYKYPFISMETLIQAEADIVFVVYHGGEAEQKVAVGKMYKPIFSKIKAVQNKRVYPLNYQKIVAPGIHTFETIRYIRKCIE